EFVGACPGVAGVKLAKGEIVKILGNNGGSPIVVEETVVEARASGRRGAINLHAEAHERGARGDYVGSLLKGPCRGRDVGRRWAGKGNSVLIRVKRRELPARHAGRAGFAIGPSAKGDHLTRGNGHELGVRGLSARGSGDLEVVA